MNPIELFIEKMRKEHLPKAAIDTFNYYYENLKTGDTGLISENDITPLAPNEIEHLSSIEHIPQNDNLELLKKVVCIKLNGGLGTTMGLEGPKSLIPVKDNLNFLEITCKQINTFNKTNNVNVPLILMNSFRTEKDSINALKKNLSCHPDIPISFTQHKFPKIIASSLLPANYPDNPELEWNPPGHGDLYIAFQTSGILPKLIDKGFRYAFISNIDNLGASLNPTILNYIAKKQISFLMEVTNRTWMDRKGGHLARLKNGYLVLREAAQCPDKDIDSFRNISRHRFFNTNNLWIDLIALKDKLECSQNFLNLPMIRNRKKLNPVDRTSPDIYQVESAMGTAISVFENSTALEVPRSRFIPVKNSEDLLLLWSDAFIIDNQFRIISNPSRKHKDITIQLDPEHFLFLNQMKSHFPHGAPSLADCKTFSIKGDICFGKNIKIIDSVELTNSQKSPIFISDNSIIDKNIAF